MFVDSSVLVAILSDEEDAGALAERIERTADCVTSPLVVLESAAFIDIIEAAPGPSIGQAAVRWPHAT